MTVEGVKAALDLYAATGTAADEAVDAAHMAIVEEFRRQRGSIPDDSGALRRSLTNPKDRAHVVHQDGDQVQVGSSVRAARFQAYRLPRPNAARVTKAIHAAYEADIAEAPRG